MSLETLVITAVASANFLLDAVPRNAQEGLQGTPAVLLGVPLGAEAVLVVKQQPLQGGSDAGESLTEFVAL
jgi:hypothetical protein